MVSRTPKEATSSSPMFGAGSCRQSFQISPCGEHPEYWLLILAEFARVGQDLHLLVS